MARKTKAEKLLEAQIDKVCSRALIDKPVNIMDLGKIAAVARNLLESGLEEETAIGYTAAYVTTIQVA